MEESEIKTSVRDLLSSDDGDGKSVRALLSEHRPPVPRRIQPNLFQELVIRDPWRRGVSWMSTGDVGSGKTALMVHIINRLFANKRQVARDLREGKIDEEVRQEYEQVAAEKIYWIGDTYCQWRRVPETATTGWAPNRKFGKLFLVEDGLKLNFFLDRSPVEIKSVPFTDFKDVVAYAEPHRLNVVYIRDPLDVMDFIQFLIDESLGEWTTVCVDEMEEICPAYMRKDNWRRAEEFALTMSQARKAKVSFYATLQAESQLDWRTPNIVPHRGFCQGARHPDGWKIYPWVCGDVPRGVAHISTRNHFQKITYPPYGKVGMMKVRGLDMWRKRRDRTTRTIEGMAEKREKAKALAKDRIFPPIGS